MDDQTRNKSQILLGLLFLFALQAGAKQESKVFFGFYGGKSFFSEEVGFYQKHYYSSHDLIFHLGGYIQYNISERFGLQFNLNYQGMVSRWGYRDFSGPNSYESTPERTDLRSFNLYLVVNWLKLKMAQFYFLGGPGITAGKWYIFDDSYFNINAGTGVIIYLTANSRPALNLGWTWRRLSDPGKYEKAGIHYSSFHIGLEF